MVKAIQCYEDSAGKLHKCPFDAHRADLAHWLSQTDDINEASARKLADWLIATAETTDTLIEMLQAINRERPAPPPVAEADTRERAA